MSKLPDCKWAQRNDKILFTINIPNLDPNKTTINVTETSFTFKSEDHELSLDFFGTVDPKQSSWKVGARDVAFVFMRKEVGDYWDTLHKGKKIHTLKVDWDKWKDEDEARDGDLDMSGFDKFDFGGAGAGGFDSDDEDEDDGRK
ncbi:hypothetical protein GUITHDRAFT_160392 [Guillardia theta CCMP2712]|uniref:CS domain-containing protein n=1 Tax=Guillardia theta (strain CCMP2712) TaxID=905079 RepID=L1K3W3_GUITC|nr:hypothetical protein GUITHDRAFT_160392 [Guillardia theta CCMP2712]EKX55165.1 hypothetical protein GUITHDRAFT_160392 [Guillardia theta CCMP2712]|eukprot:XP_005842145.1 hypothetical protein GUITHDRAFT_160392 [Guillardia theta CCMP2712]